MKYRGIVMIQMEVHAHDEEGARRVMKESAELFGLVVQQVSSVTCVDAPPKPDGTNGPRKTITDGALPNVVADDENANGGLF